MCHQSIGLVARHLEAAGIATVVIGSARDIVEECGVARFVFTDFPLGNPVGAPGDPAMQRATVALALAVAESAIAPRTTVQNPAVWPGDPGWRDRFMAIDDPAALAAAGDRRREKQAAEKTGIGSATD